MKKNIKLSIFLSLFIMMICSIMFVGTTYAWFTDTAISGNNIISTGSLDIKFEYSTNGTDWTEFNSDTQLFNCSNWAPGSYEIVYLKITNQGTLTAKGKMSNYVNEQDTIKPLREHLRLGTLTMFPDSNGNVSPRSVDDFSSTFDRLGESASNPKVITIDSFPQGASAVCAFCLIMPESVGNEANYANGSTMKFVMKAEFTQLANPGFAE